MVLSKRERYIGFGCLAVAGLLALDRLIYTPLMAQKQEIEVRIAASSEELIGARNLIRSSREKGRLWNAMSGNRLPRNASEAESQILSNVRDWAQESRLSLSSVKPERSEKEKDFYKISFRATAGGTMSQISRFLYHIQTSQVPVRITDVTINSRKEGIDDLSLTLGIATIHPVPDAEKPKPTVTAASAMREVMP